MLHTYTMMIHVILIHQKLQVEQTLHKIRKLHVKENNRNHLVNGGQSAGSVADSKKQSAQEKGKNTKGKGFSNE